MIDQKPRDPLYPQGFEDIDNLKNRQIPRPKPKENEDNDLKILKSFNQKLGKYIGPKPKNIIENEEKKKRAVRFDLMLHAYMMVQSGIPMLYSGDEIGQVNDYTYKNDPEKRVDSRYIHRGKFDWKLADGRKRKGTVQKELFDGIGKLRSIRSKEKVFDASANVWTLDTWENGILGVVRELEGEQMTALFNFAEEDRTAWIEEEGEYMDLYTGKKVSLQAIKMEGHSFVLAKKC